LGVIKEKKKRQVITERKKMLADKGEEEGFVHIRRTID